MSAKAVLLAVLLSASAAQAADAPRPAEASGPASGSFANDCAKLAAAPHRLTGTPEAAAAADYVQKRLQEIGADAIVVQPFRTVQTRLVVCKLELPGGKTLPLLPMRANGIIPPVTPEAVTGRLVHIGAGTIMDDLSGQDLRGAIAVLDYNTDYAWMRAFRLGAKAVIFVANGTAEAWHAHTVDANANLLRFYYEGKREDLPAGAQAVLHSEIVWDDVTGRNIIALFRGRSETPGAVFSLEKEEVIILAANLDSYGEVPERSPGARGAANCAALLKIAEYLKQHPARRHVLIAFFDAHARGQAGSLAFYRALEDTISTAKVETRVATIEAERSFLAGTEALLGLPDPLTTEGRDDPAAVRRQLLDRLREQAAAHAFATNGSMYDIRSEIKVLRGGAKGPKEKLAAETREAELQEELKVKWEPESNGWSDLRRALGRDRTEHLPPEVQKRLNTLLGEVRESVENRLRELQADRIVLDGDTAVKKLVGDYWISLHASLLLGDATPAWGLLIGGSSDMRSSGDNPRVYGKVQTSFLRALQSLPEQGTAPNHFIAESADQTFSQTQILTGAPALIHSGEIAGLFGIYNLVLGTVQEPQAREGTPDDTLPNLDLHRIEVQADEIARLVAAVADEEGLSLRRNVVGNKEYLLAGFENEKPAGAHVMGILPGSSLPDAPMPDAIIQVRALPAGSLAFNPRKPYAVDNFQIIRTNQSGIYWLGPALGGSAFAALFDKCGRVTSASDQGASASLRSRINVFPCRSGVIILPPQRKAMKTGGTAVRILSGRANAALDEKKFSSETADGIVCWYADKREKTVKVFGLEEMVGLNSESAPEAPGLDKATAALGQGFSMETAWNPANVGRPPSARQAAGDLWRLNDARLDILRQKDIRDASLAELHGRSQDLQTAAAGADASPLESEALFVSSFWASAPVYRRTLVMLDDLVLAVLILLGLSVPFAFAMERVLIGSPIIYRQIGWFGVFFTLTFLILYVTHPAFAIANTPIIIFLGFAVVVMSVMVIFIMMRKFQVELKRLQGMTTTVHATDVSRVSTFVAAVQMGISTMRRRPLRTALAAVTIILLTFTILCFASFGTQTGIIRLFIQPSPAYNGVWVHDVDWAPLTNDMLDVIRGRWGRQAQVGRRLWLCPQSETDPGVLITREDGSKPAVVRGVLGLDRVELKLRPDLAEVLGTDLARTILITRSVAAKLGVKQGDTVLLKGVRLRVAAASGGLDPVRILGAKDMTGDSILPVDFTEAISGQGQQQSQQAKAPQGESLLVQRNWARQSPDVVAIVSADTAVQLGAALHGIMLYTPDTASATGIAEDLVRILPFPIEATGVSGVQRHVLGTILAASGFQDLFFPILLGGLVIFGTMLGSVADREKEIYTFSALGLAPKHVATLFFAESMVYSLVGGMGGYLLAQATMKILTFLSQYGWVRVPEMNMSSTNTIVTILIVMATVLVSAIYPAIKASKSANPGLMRTWRPPEPKNDVLDLVFPFTVSEYDITGVVSFLKEHFDNHGDSGLGRFMARDTTLNKTKTSSLELRASLALAPYDLGVSQSFSLRSAPSEIPGIDEVHVRIERKSGQPKDWRRLNKAFLDGLRKQFLIWRSIPHETMEIYRRRTLETMAGGEQRTA